MECDRKSIRADFELLNDFLLKAMIEIADKYKEIPMDVIPAHLRPIVEKYSKKKR